MKLFRNKRIKPYLLLLPAFVLTVGLLGYGTLYGMLQSFQKDLEWSFDAYIELIHLKAFKTSLIYSLFITLQSTLLALGIGMAITHFLYPYLQKDKWKAVIWIPMLFPHFAAGYLIVMIFSDSGWMSSLFMQMGLIQQLDQFPNLVNDSKGVGIILTYTWKEIPFVVLMLLPIYAQMDSRLKDVATTLGGNKLQVFLSAQWPFLWPTLVEIALILFAFIFAAFEVPYLLGVTYPQMTPVLAFEWFFDGNWDQRPLAFASMVIVTLWIVVLTSISYSSIQKYRHRLMRGS
ncbi:ABC transporter permease [Pseudalkalibacillus berkeleyi]|uniref:ABC transporter permease subunit n=1 Tax=Pseudalkalibacillus berkeleyi TaxID=1069813 RepID=A0ABS9H0H6_9BACL|nr:ABC transporter permease subunit [Pseudalkalibacillus berkeleyi]MCF6137421.1 ABC transporter permease subunit [Pseudalkalibacillus berkeleyi]